MPDTKIKICLVDDDQNILDIYTKKLTSRGYQIVSASDGKIGLEIMRAEKPDLAMIDVNMPEMDGLTLMEHMQQEPALEKIPVIVLTNEDNEPTIRRASQISPEFFLLKAQTDPQKAVEVIEKVLSERQSN